MDEQVIEGECLVNVMMKLLEDLTPLNRVFSSNDYDRAVSYLNGLLPFRVIEYSASQEHNGWVIPPKWEVKEAKILERWCVGV